MAEDKDKARELTEQQENRQRQEEIELMKNPAKATKRPDRREAAERREELDVEALSDRDREELEAGKRSERLTQERAKELEASDTGPRYVEYPDSDEEVVYRGYRRWTDENGVRHKMPVDEDSNDDRAPKSGSDERNNVK